MPKPPRFTPNTWSDQQRLLADADRTSDGIVTLLLFGFGAFALGWVALVVYVFWGIFR